MVKKILITLLLSMSTLYADWVDDLAQLTEHKSNPAISDFLEVIEKHISHDKDSIMRIEKQSTGDKKESGFWEGVRSGTYAVELKTARASLHYLEKVAGGIKELAENKKERERFIDHLRAIQKIEQKIAQLKKDYDKTDDMGKHIKIGALVAAKKAELHGRKALLKSSFLFCQANPDPSST